MEPTHNVVLAELGANVVYLMGFSFVLGSLFTVLLLILLDFMRRHNAPAPAAKPATKATKKAPAKKKK